VNPKSDVVMMTAARTRKVWDTTLVTSSIASPFIKKFSYTLKINVTKYATEETINDFPRKLASLSIC
jgi:hypothetical protein